MHYSFIDKVCTSTLMAACGLLPALWKIILTSLILLKTTFFLWNVLIHKAWMHFTEYEYIPAYVCVCVLCACIWGCKVLQFKHRELAPATEKGQKRLNWVAPLGCQAAARFHGNRGVWLAARPCSVESHCIEANLNIHPFLSQHSPLCKQTHLTAEMDTQLYINLAFRHAHI